MLHLHLIGLLTFEFLTLIAAIFLMIYVNQKALSNWYRHFSKAIVIVIHVIIVVTFVHGIVHHFQDGSDGSQMHREIFKHHMGH